jgi:hypothetical protein
MLFSIESTNVHEKSELGKAIIKQQGTAQAIGKGEGTGNCKGNRNHEAEGVKTEGIGNCQLSTVNF